MPIDKKSYLYTKGSDPALDTEFAASTKYAKVRLAPNTLFWRSALRQYAISLDQPQRIFRRILPVRGRLCAGGRNYDMEYLVLILPQGELEIHIGDDEKQAAVALLEALKAAHPGILYGKE